MRVSYGPKVTRWGIAAGALVTGALVTTTIAGTATTARASASATWKIAKILASPSVVTNLYQAAAIGRGNVWAVGAVSPLFGPDHGLVEHWNGTSWANRNPSAKAADLRYSDLTAIAASSRTNVWAAGTSVSNSYALYWNGSKWRRFSFHKGILMTAVAAFSPQDVWMFGNDNGPAVERFDGRRWHFSWMPAFADSASALSPSDIWAVGARSVKESTKLVLSHWTGRSWQLISAPKVGTKKGNYLTYAHVLAFSDTEVFVDAELTGATGNSLGPVLLRWDGQSWKVFRCPLTKTALTQMVPDSQGGLWLAAGAGPPNPGYFIHFTATGGWGWQQAPLPKSGYSPVPYGIVDVPGTSQMFAVGTVIEGGEAVIYQYR